MVGFQTNSSSMEEEELEEILSSPIQNGWDIDISDSLSKDSEKNLIKLANIKIPIVTAIKKVKPILLSEQYSPSGWTLKSRCPFDDHNDSSPSFGINPQDNCFYCFGCRRGGGPVQAIFYLKNKNISQREIAENILKEYGNLNDAYEKIKANPDGSVDKLLLDFSEYVFDFNINNGSDKAKKFIEAITWSLDIYIEKHVMEDNINFLFLKKRIELLKNKMDKYER